MATCPSCGTPIDGGAKFCSSCGSPLSTVIETPAVPMPATETALQITPQPASEPISQATQSTVVISSAPHSQEPINLPPYQPFPYPQRPTKDRGVALILEILPGMFGFLGFGWIYSGNTTAGVIWLICFFAWTVLAAIIDVATVGIFLLCSLPISIACIAVSAISLNSYSRKHPELFG
jgi:hypothetical protein